MVERNVNKLSFEKIIYLSPISSKTRQVCSYGDIITTSSFAKHYKIIQAYLLHKAETSQLWQSVKGD